MNDFLSGVLEGGLAVFAGLAIFLNLGKVADLDQRYGRMFNSWLKKRLGDPFLVSDVWSVGTPKGKRNSKIGLGFVACVLILGGIGLIVVAVHTQVQVDRLLDTPSRTK